MRVRLESLAAVERERVSLQNREIICKTIENLVSRTIFKGIQEYIVKNKGHPLLN